MQGGSYISCSSSTSSIPTRKTGTAAPNPHRQLMSEALDAAIVAAHHQFSLEPQLQSRACTLIVFCPWARPMAVGYNGVADPRWRVDSISAADVEVLSQMPGIRAARSVADSRSIGGTSHR